MSFPFDTLTHFLEWLGLVIIIAIFVGRVDKSRQNRKRKFDEMYRWMEEQRDKERKANGER